MTISGTKAAGKVKGFFGAILAVTPILALIPHPAIQAAVASVNEFIIALVGVGGIALQASSPAIFGKNKDNP